MTREQVCSVVEAIRLKHAAGVEASAYDSVVMLDIADTIVKLWSASAQEAPPAKERKELPLPNMVDLRMQCLKVAVSGSVERNAKVDFQRSVEAANFLAEWLLGNVAPADWPVHQQPDLFTP